MILTVPFLHSAHVVRPPRRKPKVEIFEDAVDVLIETPQEAEFPVAIRAGEGDATTSYRLRNGCLFRAGGPASAPSVTLTKAGLPAGTRGGRTLAEDAGVRHVASSDRDRSAANAVRTAGAFLVRDGELWIPCREPMIEVVPNGPTIHPRIVDRPTSRGWDVVRIDEWSALRAIRPDLFAGRFARRYVFPLGVEIAFPEAVSDLATRYAVRSGLDLAVELVDDLVSRGGRIRLMRATEDLQVAHERFVPTDPASMPTSAGRAALASAVVALAAKHDGKRNRSTTLEWVSRGIAARQAAPDLDEDAAFLVNML